jgi:hypothetical protein
MLLYVYICMICSYCEYSVCDVSYDCMAMLADCMWSDVKIVFFRLSFSMKITPTADLLSDHCNSIVAIAI